MDKVIYEGKTYMRQGGKWIDSRYMVVYEGLQRELNKEFAKQINPDTLSLEECLSQGDAFKNTGSGFLALKFYEQAAKTATRQTMAYILPRMTSCYRQTGQAQKAIDILAMATQKFGQGMVTPELLTSVAAAYCDLGDYVRAKKCCDRAYASGGKSSAELSLVYKRINKSLTPK